jgi:hypothetical protein
MCMTEEEWITSTSASGMLARLHEEQPCFLRTQVGQLHQFLIACCWKHQNLIPQECLRNGLLGAERWIAGEIGDDELNRLNWYAEAEAFRIDYAKSSDEMAAVNSIVASIEELRDLPFLKARRVLLNAAYFAEGSMIYPMFNSLPWVDRLMTSQFLCTDLLRQHIRPSFKDSA